MRALHYKADIIPSKPDVISWLNNNTKMNSVSKLGYPEKYYKSNLKRKQREKKEEWRKKRKKKRKEGVKISTFKKEKNSGTAKEMWVNSLGKNRMLNFWKL